MFDTENRDGITFLHMQHGKANAMDLEFCRQFVVELEEINTPATKALVITGSGKIFSAGVDLPRLLDGGQTYVHEFLPVLNEFFRTVFTFPKPVLAAINGHAVAGGCVLACAADRRLMSQGDSRIGVPELRVGVPFPPEALEIMRVSLPPQYFSEVMYTGATYDTKLALERGLIDEVVEPDQLLDCAADAGERMAALGSGLFRLTKAQIRQPTMERIDRGAQYAEEIEAIWTAPETLAGIRQYVEERLKSRR